MICFWQNVVRTILGPKLRIYINKHAVAFWSLSSVWIYLRYFCLTKKDHGWQKKQEREALALLGILAFSASYGKIYTKQKYEESVYSLYRVTSCGNIGLVSSYPHLLVMDKLRSYNIRSTRQVIVWLIPIGSDNDYSNSCNRL